MGKFEKWHNDHNQANSSEMQPILRSHEIHWKPAVLGTAGVVLAGLGIWKGFLPVWSEVDSRKTVEAVGFSMMAIPGVYLAGSFLADREENLGSNNRRTRRTAAVLAACLGAGIWGAMVVSNNEDVQKTLKLPTVTAVETGSSLLPNTSGTTSQDVQSGQCKLTAPIPTTSAYNTLSKDQQHAVDEDIIQLKKDLKASGFDPGDINPKANQALGLVVDAAQIGAGMSEQQAHEIKWGQETCKLFANSYPAFQNEWVQG